MIAMKFFVPLINQPYQQGNKKCRALTSVLALGFGD
jgi:hypothetical protein